jgi:ankyrin repeat protein
VPTCFGLVQVIRILQHRGEIIGQVDESKRTALHWAAINNRLGAAKALIEFNAPINPQDKNGYTPLHEAYSEEMVNLLLSRSADVKMCNHVGQTALHAAAMHGNADSARALINAGSSVNVLDSKNRSPLHLLAARLRSYNYSPTIQAEYKSTVDILIQNGADYKLTDRNGKTAM